jgi:hypothetical protein
MSAGLRLAPWAAIPIWNGLGTLVRAYTFLDLMLVQLAAIGLGQLQRRHSAWRPAAVVVGVFIASYVALATVVLGAPAVFEEFVRRFWSSPAPDQAPIVVLEATTALSQMWSAGLEIVFGIAMVVMIWRRRRQALALFVAGALAILAGLVAHGAFWRVTVEPRADDGLR